jgi:hypothetical protein
MGLALAWLVAAAAMLAIHPDLLSLPHSHPRVVALAHAWVLGFLVTVACGAIYQLAPVALGTTLSNERHGWWHFGLHTAGVPGMVYSFWVWDTKQLGHFGFMVAMGIALFSANTWTTVRRSGRRGTVAWSLILAAAWLLLTVVLGLLLAANRFWYFIPIDPIALLRAHAHLGLVGFFVTLLQGVGFQLVPMFTLGEVRDWKLANTGLWFSQLGLLVLVPAFVGRIAPLALLGAAAIASGMICSAVGLKRALATRKKRALDPGTRTFLQGGIGLCVAAVAGVVLLSPVGNGSVPGGFSANVFLVLVMFGGLLPCIAGMMCKIVPFLTWMRAYGPRVGRGPTPAANALGLPRIERAGLALQHLAVVPLVIGAWTLDQRWLGAGAGLLAIGVALFATDMLGVLRHLWITPPAASNRTPAPKT